MAIRAFNLRGPVIAAVLTALLCVTHYSAESAAQSTGDAKEARRDARVAAYARLCAETASLANGFSGAVIVARHGVPLFARAYGLADREAYEANQLDTKFNVGSMNKMMTAIAVAQLVEGGKLSFQDTLGKYLPDFANPEARAVTVHQLLTHTGGLGDFLGPGFAEARDRLRTPADFLPLFASQPLKFSPGTSWAYSNGGYIVLGLIVERVSGQSYEDYVREHIAVPAGMVNTGFYALDEPTGKRAKGYTRVGPDGKGDLFRRWDSARLNLVKGCPAGGGFSTAEDLLRFANAIMGHTLLNAEYTGLVTTAKVDVNPPDPDKHYAYGFFDMTTRGVRHYGHGGAMYGVNADLHIFPESGYVVITLSNYDPPSAQRLAKKITGFIASRAS